MEITSTLINFIINLIISGIIIYLATKLLGEGKSIITAILAAFIGALITSLSIVYLGSGFLSYIISVIVWLLALKILYKIGWIKSIITALAIVIINFLFEVFVLVLLLKLIF